MSNYCGLKPIYRSVLIVSQMWKRFQPGLQNFKLRECSVAALVAILSHNGKSKLLPVLTSFPPCWWCCLPLPVTSQSIKYDRKNRRFTNIQLLHTQYLQRTSAQSMGWESEETRWWICYILVKCDSCNVSDIFEMKPIPPQQLYYPAV